MTDKTSTIDSSSSHSVWSSLKETYKYRDLLVSLMVRDLRAQYTQTFLGFLWVLIKPVTSILILSFVFGSVAKVGTGDTGIPHLLFTTIGYCSWSYFSSVLSGAGNSILSSQQMVKKIYFPRLVLPLSKILTSFIDFTIALFLVIVLFIFFNIFPSIKLFWLFTFIFFIIACGFAGGIWLSALTIRYRDFIHISPFLLQLCFYACPIAYSSSLIPDKYQGLYFLNPMAGIIEGFRWSLVGSGSLHENTFISIIVTLVLLISGLLYFNKIQNKIADWV